MLFFDDAPALADWAAGCLVFSSKTHKQISFRNVCFSVVVFGGREGEYSKQTKQKPYARGRGFNISTNVDYFAVGSKILKFPK